MAGNISILWDTQLKEEMMKIAASVTPNITRFGPLLFAGELERGFKELAALGYDGIELSLRTSNDINSDLLFQLLNEYNLELISIATGQSYLEDGLSLFAMEKEKRVETINRIKDLIDLADKVDATVILGGIKGRLDGIDDKVQYFQGRKAIEECVEYGEEKKVVLLLESINRYESNIFNTVKDSHEFAVSIKSEYLKILPDTFHMNIEEKSIIESLYMGKDVIGALHCADNNRLAPGMGHVDFKPIIECAKKLPNLRYLGVEVLPLPDSSLSARTAIETIKSYM